MALAKYAQGLCPLNTMSHRSITLILGLLIIVAVVGGITLSDWSMRTGQEPSATTFLRHATSSLRNVLPKVGPSAAEAQEGLAVATPSVIAVNEPTDVNVTIQITDPRLIPGSVTLQRLDAAGNVVGILGTLNDAGIGGDAVAGDGILTIRRTFTESVTAPVLLRVSWALRGVLRRFTSNTVAVEVWVSFLNTDGRYSFLGPPDWVVEAGTVVPSSTALRPPDKVRDPEMEYVADIFIRAIPNPNGLNLRDFYQAVGDGRVDLFRASRTQTEFQVRGLDAVRFDGTFGKLPGTVVAIRFNDRVIEITDFGEEHEADGILTRLIESIHPVP